jgi:hypothetical protein
MNKLFYGFFQSFYDYGIVLYLILLSGYVGFMQQGQSNFILYFFYLFFSFGIFIYRKKLIIPKLDSTFLILLLLFFSAFFGMILYPILNNESFRLTFSIIVLFLCTFFVVKSINFSKFIFIYSNIIFAISIVSLFFFLSLNILNFEFTFSLISTNIAQYRSYIFFYQLVLDTSRNLGIFWEPGLFSSYLILALILNSFSIKFNFFYFFKTLVFSLTILTTFSTAGILLLPLFYTYLFLLSSRNNLSKVFLIFSVFILLLYSDNIISLLVDLYPNIFGKLIFSSATLIDRFLSPIVHLNLFFQSPIFGLGYYGSNLQYQFISSSFGVYSQTSTYGAFISSLGISGFFFIFFFLFKVITIKNNNFFAYFFLSILFSLIFNKEPHEFLALSYVIIFYMIEISGKI